MAFPTTARRGGSNSGGDATTWTPTFVWVTNDDIPANVYTRWYMFVASDGNPTLSTPSPGWVLNATNQSAGSVRSTVWYKDEANVPYAPGFTPAFTLNSSVAESFTAILYAVYGTSALKPEAIGNIGVATGNSANSTNQAVVNDTLRGTLDVSSIVYRAGDAQVEPAAAPVSYTNFQTRPGSSTNGAASAAADRNVSVAASASVAPAAWNVPTEQWVTFHYCTYLWAAADLAGGGVKVWNGSAWVQKPVKVWNGSAWVTKPLKVWNGSAWVLA